MRVTEFIDISQQKIADAEKARLEADFIQAQKMEIIGQLAGGGAHDLNNMLGVIIGHTEMALHKIEASAPAFSDLIQIEKAAVRSVKLVGQLLVFARKQTVTPKVQDLNDTLEGLMQMLYRLIGEDMELAWVPGNDLWLVQMDPSQIDQILANLCVNVRDAIADIGRITVMTHNIVIEEAASSEDTMLASGEYVCVTVRDNGCGMDKETLKHIFEPFFTTKQVGQGTGLGLATVYGTVKHNGGVINVSSELGWGTTFEIYLPRYIGSVFHERIDDMREDALKGKETILIVEDEKEMLVMSKQMLKSMGYRVLSAGSPAEALHINENYSEDIDLLLSDVIMSHMNGRDLADRIKSNRPSIKILYMSGYTADIITKQGLMDEGVNLLQKPFTQKQLGYSLRYTLENE